MSSLRRASRTCHTYVKKCSQNWICNGSRPQNDAFFSRRQLLSTSSFTSLDSSDIELAYTTYPQNEESLDSSKRPLIFLHGLFGAKGNLHSVAKHLASDGRKIVTFDARNHGDSGHSDQMDYYCMRDDLHDLVEELQLGQPVILGHSMGGKTAMVTALTEPDSLSTLIVADVTPNLRSTSATDALKKFAEAMRVANIPQDVNISQARKAVQVQLTPAVPDRGILSFLLTNLREFPDGKHDWRNNLDAVINNFNTVASFPDLEGKSFSKPTLFVFGAESHHYKSLDLGLVKQYFPKVEVDVIPGAGHFVHADKPLEFVKVVNEFLKAVENNNSRKS